MAARAPDTGNSDLPPEIAALQQRSNRAVHLAVFRALSEPIRLEILSLIASAGDGEEFPCTGLEESLPVSKSTISYHIKILHEAGLVEVAKDGRNYHYRLRRGVLEQIAPTLLEEIAQ